jgi:hypothetical protein
MLTRANDATRVQEKTPVRMNNISDVHTYTHNVNSKHSTNARQHTSCRQRRWHSLQGTLYNVSAVHRTGDERVDSVVSSNDGGGDSAGSADPRAQGVYASGSRAAVQHAEQRRGATATTAPS